MPTINLRPIQTGDACYLLDHHNRPGECIITVAMSDGCSTSDAAKEELAYQLYDTIGDVRFADVQEYSHVAAWCAREWQLAKDDMPAAADRDNEGGDEADRYLECHILATWEA